VIDWPLVKWEFLQTATDKGFLVKVAFGMLVGLLLMPFLASSAASFSEGSAMPSLPFAVRLVRIAVVGDSNEFVTQLQQNTIVSLMHTDEAHARELLTQRVVAGIFIVTDSSGLFVGDGTPFADFAESQVRDALDNVVRREQRAGLEVIQGTSVEPFVRGLLAPFILLTPILLLCLPIIQSLSYDRENHMYEVLFAVPIDRKKIFFSKILANLLFVGLATLIWLFLVGLVGIFFTDVLGVWFMLVLVSLLILSLNALVSTLSSNAKNATLASSISSTMVFSGIAVLTLLRVSPLVSRFAELSPVTYISYQTTGLATAFPIPTVLVFLVITFTALLLALSAFSTEKFAFSLDPGILQLYEGVLELLKHKWLAALAMGFVAFSLSIPVQVMVLGTLFFLNSKLLMILIFLISIEEILKFIGVRMLKPESLQNALLFGAFIGIGYGLSEAFLFVPYVDAFFLRSIPLFAHVLFTVLTAIGIWLKHPYPFLAASIALHVYYNSSLVSVVIS